MHHYFDCPVCKSNAVRFSFSAIDHTVSGESFEIWSCDNCSLMFTQDVPAEAEIGRYYASPEYVSHSDTREGIVNKLYHQVKKYTLREKKALIEKETGLAAGKLLDIGCGTGAFLHTVQEAGWQVTGVEPDAGARQKADETYQLKVRPSHELYTLIPGSYDAITMWHVLEHVHSLHECVQQCRQLLSEKGRLLVAVPNHTSVDARHYKDQWAAYDVPRHLYHFSPHSMNVLMNAHGLQIKKIRPMWFDSFYVSMLSEKFNKEKGNIVNALITGLSSNYKALVNPAKCSSVIYVIGK